MQQDAIKDSIIVLIQMLLFFLICHMFPLQNVSKHHFHKTGKFNKNSLRQNQNIKE